MSRMLEFFSRRIFLQLAAVFVAQSRSAPASTQPVQPAQSSLWTGAVLQANEGEHLVAGRRRAPMRIKVDSTKAIGATMSMVISEVAPGANIPIHLHRNEDELIFLHTGTGIVTLGERQVPSSTGAVLYAPKVCGTGLRIPAPLFCDVVRRLVTSRIRAILPRNGCSIWSRRVRPHARPDLGKRAQVRHGL